MKKSIFAVFLVLALLAGPGTSYAETLQGEVADLGASEFFLKVSSEKTGKTELKQILVSSETEFEGTNLDELRTGDEVLVEVPKSAGKVLSARKVKLDKVDIRN